MMSRIMTVPVFQIPKTQISSPFDEFEEENSFFNLKLTFPENKFSNNSECKRNVRNTETELLPLENLFDETKKNKGLHRNSKSCRKSLLANSDDENFWRAAMIHFDSKENRKKCLSREMEEIGDSETNIFEEDYDSEDMSEENIFSGNITVTIKDKPVIESKEETFEILRKSFEAFKMNAQEARRLRELKIKVQEKISMKRLRRYFDAWRNRITSLKVLEKKRKEDRELSNERKIELFINAIAEKQKQLKRLRKCTSSSSPRAMNPELNQRCKSAPDEIIDTVSKNNLPKSNHGFSKSNSQSKLQIQRKIIEQQRMKLAQQNKIIEDLKLKEIEREARKAHRDTIDATRGALNFCERGTRRSLISLMKEQGCKDESAESLRVPETPDFLIRMEARAEARRERVRRSEEARVRRIEEERRKEDEARKKEEIERKRLQIEAQKEAKRLREEREEKRIREAEKAKLNNEKADNFYRIFLLRRVIFHPLRTLLIEKRELLSKSIKHHNHRLIKNYFSAWKSVIDQQYAIKEELANSIYKRNLLWSTFVDWRQCTSEERQKYHVASDFHDFKVQLKLFKIWQIHTIESAALDKKNEQIAHDYRDTKLKRKFFYLWMRFPQIADQVKESEKRKRELRELVQRVIPDFDPKHRGVAIDD